MMPVWKSVGISSVDKGTKDKSTNALIGFQLQIDSEACAMLASCFGKALVEPQPFVPSLAHTFVLVLLVVLAKPFAENIPGN